MGDAVHWRIEKSARRIAAIKMGLVKDRDGERLPDDLWRQCIREAEYDYERGYVAQIAQAGSALSVPLETAERTGRRNGGVGSASGTAQTPAPSSRNLRNSPLNSLDGAAAVRLCQDADFERRQRDALARKRENFAPAQNSLTPDREGDA